MISFNQMVKYSENKIDNIFQSLADATRRDIILRIIQKELGVTEIASAYKMSLPAISKHLKVLEQADLIMGEKRGRERYYLANPKALLEIQKYIEFYTRFWNKQFDKLDDFLKREKVKK